MTIKKLWRCHYQPCQWVGWTDADRLVFIDHADEEFTIYLGEQGKERLRDCDLLVRVAVYRPAGTRETSAGSVYNRDLVSACVGINFPKVIDESLQPLFTFTGEIACAITGEIIQVSIKQEVF